MPGPQVTRARWRWAAVALGAGLTGIFVLTVARTGSARSEGGGASDRIATSEDATAPVRPVAAAPELAPTPEQDDIERVRGIDHFEMRSVYPPTSRPLSFERNPDLIEPNTPETVWMPVSGGPLEVALHTDVAWLTGDGPLGVFLETRGAPDPAALEVTRAQALLRARRGAPLPAGAEAPVDVALTRTGARWEGSLVPASLWTLERQVTIELQVELRYGPARWQQVRAAVLYTPAAAVPARFTGRGRDTVEDGSLVVHAGIEVNRPGWYVVDANLWSDDEQPVAWTRWKGELAAGRHELPLRFFGKVLVDKGAPSPWRVRQLRGFLLDADSSPAEVAIPPLPGELRTRAWRLDQLSDAEWNDPRRDAERAKWQELEASGQSPPVPAEAFEHDVGGVGP